MYVCLCHGVSEEDIADLIGQGICDFEGLQASCRAGSDCGACLPEVRAKWEALRPQTPGTQPTTPSASSAPNKSNGHPGVAPRPPLPFSEEVTHPSSDELNNALDQAV